MQQAKTMKHRAVWTGFVAVAVLTVGGGLIHGRLSNRWGPTQTMVDAGSRLQRIPSKIGDWEQKSSAELTEAVRTELETTGDITRTYAKPATNLSVSFTMIVGPVGPVSVHTPEVCFPSQNHRLMGNRTCVQIRDALGKDHEFWMVTFRSKGLEARLVRVYYAWSTGGNWSAPENPRFGFIGCPFLYKLQLTDFVSAADSADLVPEFLREFLPVAGVEMVGAASTYH